MDDGWLRELRTGRIRATTQASGQTGVVANKTKDVEDVNQCHEKKDVIVQPAVSASKTSISIFPGVHLNCPVGPLEKLPAAIDAMVSFPLLTSRGAGQEASFSGLPEGGFLVPSLAGRASPAKLSALGGGGSRPTGTGSSFGGTPENDMLQGFSLCFLFAEVQLQFCSLPMFSGETAWRINPCGCRHFFVG